MMIGQQLARCEIKEEVRGNLRQDASRGCCACYLMLHTTPASYYTTLGLLVPTLARDSQHSVMHDVVLEV
jgi:hypothetical protein